MFICPICHNKDPIYIGYKDKKPYCRKCITFTKGKKASQLLFENKNLIKAHLSYSLTNTQKKASNEIYTSIQRNESVIVNAVCGAGKTELVYQSIEFILNQNKKVAFAIPRKDVVIEIYFRLKKDYPQVKVCAVYGGHTNDLQGQLIVLTTHQLFRYKNYFDLLILDEADAFPYYQNDLLSLFLKESLKGPIIYLSATIRDSYKKECLNIVYVNRRFHNYDMPVPIYKKYTFFNCYLVLNNILKTLLKRQQPILLFVPTIEIGLRIKKKLSFPFVYANNPNKTDILSRFKRKEFPVLITTTILERGITIKAVNVIVFEANHRLFDESSLIQISGRVGRKLSCPTGSVYFLATHQSDSMKKCIKEIKRKNHDDFRKENP